MAYISVSNRACNFKSPSRFALVRFWNYSRDYSLNCTPLGPITITYYIIIVIIIIIVSITKFSIVIGSPRAYFSHNQRAITWVSNYRCPIWTFCNWIPVIGHPCDLHVNYASCNGFFPTVSHNFQLWKALQMFFLKRTSQKTFLIRKFVIDTIN